MPELDRLERKAEDVCDGSCPERCDASCDVAAVPEIPQLSSFKSEVRLLLDSKRLLMPPPSFEAEAAFMADVAG